MLGGDFFLVLSLPLLNKIQECIDLSVVDDDEAGASDPSTKETNSEAPADLSTSSSEVVDEMLEVSEANSSSFEIILQFN